MLRSPVYQHAKMGSNIQLDDAKVAIITGGTVGFRFFFLSRSTRVSLFWPLAYMGPFRAASGSSSPSTSTERVGVWRSWADGLM